MATNWNCTRTILIRCSERRPCARRWNAASQWRKSWLDLSRGWRRLRKCANRFCCITERSSMRPKYLIAVLLTLLWAVPPAIAEGFRAEKLAEMDAAIREAIASNQCPGGVLWLERGGVSYHKAFGNRALVPARESMTEETIFDAASLTKIVATTPAVM